MAKRTLLLRRFYWASFLALALGAVSFGGASIATTPALFGPSLRPDPTATRTLRELNRLGLLRNATQPAIEQLLTHQRRTGKPLTQLLREPYWLSTLGLTATSFRATWYAANPFDMLPLEMQHAIRQVPEPFRSRSAIEKWCASLNAPESWKTALNYALVETTAENLWRAARGKRPFTKNGQYLEPIVIEKGGGVYDVHDGHIATDPSVIPTNSVVLMLVRIGGKERLLRVKAADTGNGVRGTHVDLPIQIRPKLSSDPNAPIRFPKEYIRNDSVMILMPGVSRGRKASAGRLSRLPS